MSAASAPLSGYRVLEAGDSAAVALAGMFLAELGADVVKLEWDRTVTSAFLASNRSKRSVAVGNGDAVLVQELLDGADVLLLDASVARRRAQDCTAELLYEASQQAGCRLSIAHVSAYGRVPSLALLPWSSTLAAALSGHIGSQWAFRDGGTYPVNDFGSAITGIETAIGVIVSLLAREREGVARTSHTSVLGGWLSLRMLHAVTGVGVTSVSGRDPQGGMSPLSRFYRAGDGKWLVLACSTPQFWGKLCIVLDRHDLVGDPRFDQAPFGIPVEHRPALTALLDASFLTEARDVWIEKLRAGDVPCAPVSSPAEAYADGQLAANGGVVEFDQPGFGTMRQLAPLVRFDGVDCGPPRPFPALGADTDAVKQEWDDRASWAASLSGSARSRLPLSGIRVLEIGTWVVGPSVGMMLRQLGAEVWKVEPISGDDVSTLMYVYRPINAGKHVIRVDLRTSEGKELLSKLIAATDAVYHNQRPHVAEKFGFDEPSVRRMKPDAVYHQIYSYGRTGPLAGDPAFDQLVPTRAGLSYLQGGMSSGNPPVMHNGSQGDLPGGCIATMAVVAGLLRAQRNGLGTTAAGCSSWSTLAEAGYLLGCLEMHEYEGRPPLVKGGVDFVGPDAAHRLYRCAASTWVVVVAEDAEKWDRVADLTGIALGSFDDACLEPSDGAVALALGASFATRTAHEWARSAEATGAPVVAAVHDSIVCEQPAVIENSYDCHAVIDSDSTFGFPGHVIQFDGHTREGVLTTPEPVAGAREILGQLGYDEVAIDRLAAMSVVMA